MSIPITPEKIKPIPPKGTILYIPSDGSKPKKISRQELERYPCVGIDYYDIKTNSVICPINQGKMVINMLASLAADDEQIIGDAVQIYY